MNLREKNLAVLRDRWPEMARRVEAARSRKSRPGRSEADAQRLAARWLHDRRIRNGALLAVTGFGDGVHVRQLLRVLPPRARLFVSEATAVDLRAAFEARDHSAVLADPRLTLGVGECDEEFFRSLEKLSVLHVTDVQPMIFAPLYNEAPEYQARFLTEFARQFDMRRKLEGTRVVDAELWQANSFANLPHLVSAPDVAVLRGALTGLPLVIVSAGPSLDESLDFLRAASRVAVVVAVNSSYRALRHAGIVPPLVLAADPREFTERGFAGVPCDGTFLATTHIVHPAVVCRFAGRTFTWSGSNELVQTLRRRCGLAPGTAIVEQGTVSACAVDLAMLMGCDRICLVGQDLAVQGDGRSHARDTFYSDLGMNHTATADCRKLPGNTLPEVLVEGKLYIYLKVFEQLVIHRPRLKWLNTARLGARIAGVPYAGFDEALAWLGRGSAAKVGAVLARRHAAGGPHCLDGDRLRAALGGTRPFATRVLQAALRAAVGLESLPDAVLAPGGESDPAVLSALAAVAEIEDLIAKFSDEAAILEEGRARLELYKVRTIEAQLSEAREHVRRILVGREFAWAMAEGAWFLENCLEHLDRELVGKSGPTP